MTPRVVFHTPEPKSAAARYVWELVKALTTEGLRIDLVCPQNIQFRGDLETNSNITLHPTQARSTSNTRSLLTRVRHNLVFLASSLSGLIRASRRGDVVHFQFILHFPFGALFFLAARLRGCKIVFTVHDPMPHRWLLPRSLRWLEHSALAWAYRVSHRLIVHSEPGKSTLVECFSQDPKRISIIAHGPYDLGHGVMPMSESETLELLVFGSIRENKGIHLAIQAVQALCAESEKVRLTIAGDVLNSKEQPYWDSCLRLIDSNPAPIRIMKEFVPDPKLLDLFAGCHCVLLPYTEFFSDSGVAQMALSNGRPILATRSGGLAPLMEQADIGVPILEISSGGVVEAIRSALQLGQRELERRGINGAILVNQNGNAWRKIAEQTCAVYLQLGVPFAGPERGTAFKPGPTPTLKMQGNNGRAKTQRSG